MPSHNDGSGNGRFVRLQSACAHEQQKARLAEQKAKIKLAEHKSRTRRLVETDALAEKTGSLGLDSNPLYAGWVPL